MKSADIAHSLPNLNMADNNSVFEGSVDVPTTEDHEMDVETVPEDSSVSESADDMDLDEKKPKAKRPVMKKERREELAADKAALKSKKASDAVKRYAYLVGQTEIFSHFINLSKKKAGVNVDMDVPLSPTSAKYTGDRRHRKTEKEEDDELLEAEKDNKETVVIDESPSYVKHGKMRDYQLEGLTWLISLYDNGINGILADEMGLGKTLQTISFLGYLKHYRGVNGPHLVIVPKSTLHNWVSEFNRWVPDINVFMFHGDKQQRADLVSERLLPGTFEVCVTSYEVCLLEKNHLKKLSWQYLVIDEAHRIKNENSALSQIVRLFECRNRLLITGTPLQNNLHELWALLNFLLPDVFSSAEDFDDWFKTQGDQDKVIQQLHKVLQPFLLRRIKADVEKSLLPKKKINLYVGMSHMQRQWYKKLMEKDIDAVNGAVKDTKSSKTRLLNIAMQLRKCCNHPYLFDGAEPGPPFTTDQHLVDNAGKMDLLDKLLPRLKANGSRVLLFSQMSRMLDILEDYCVMRGYGYCRIDGNTAHVDRVSQIDEFNAPGSEKFIFLLTTRAGGLGINLATADIVIMYDNDWNPQVDLQAEDRAHRIGQTKQVVVFRFVTENSIEEKVLERATQKLKLDQLVIQQGKAQAQNKAASKDELLAMIQHGAESVFNGPDSTISDANIEEILARGEQKTAELEAKFKDAGIDALQNFAVNSTSVWEGTDYSTKRKKINTVWIEPSKRERHGNYSIDAYFHAVTGIKGTRGPRKQGPQFFDFQLFPKRFYEIIEKEKYWGLKQKGYVVPKSEKEDDTLAEEKRKAEQDKIDNAQELTEKEIAEKEKLLQAGFPNWSQRDFRAFVRASEKHGRNNLEAIAKEMGANTQDGDQDDEFSKIDLAEVKRYAQRFWKQYKEFKDGERAAQSIERAEKEMGKQNQVQNWLEDKFKSIRHPMQELDLGFLGARGRGYTDEEDRFMLVRLEHYGYGNEEAYDQIRLDIRTAPQFRYDWFIKSRTTLDIKNRLKIFGKTLERIASNSTQDQDSEIEDGASTKKKPKKK